MIFPILFAASLSFTATATGLQNGGLVEFVFAGENTDRDYETLFILDESLDSICARLEKGGLPRGRPDDAAACRFWPVGCRVSFKPSLAEFLEMKLPEGLAAPQPVYTGGTRTTDGRCVAGTMMPAAFFSTYTLAQAPIVFDGIFPQGVVYGSITAKKELKKGTKVSFTLSWDADSLPRKIELLARPGKAVEFLADLRTQSEKRDLDVTVSFDETMTVREATQLSKALLTLDSPRIKLNGKGNVFYRSFTPDESWLDRTKRVVQPFELTLGVTNRLLYVDEDWSGEGVDPKLTPREIKISDVPNYKKTDTCFIFADNQTSVGTILKAMKLFSAATISNWYVFGQ